MKTIEQIVAAAARADWQQVALNGGPPCFHLQEDGSFCLRAERWAGHQCGQVHCFVTLAELLNFVVRAATMRQRAHRNRPTCPRCGRAECSGVFGYPCDGTTEHV